MLRHNMSMFGRLLLAALLAYFVSLAQGAQIAYCSPENTGADTGFQAVYNQYNSDGSCQVKCQGSYAFAILQGTDCWCSNYAPSNQKQTNLCDDPCPGYQSDWCGSSSAGLYGYIALSIAPSGTIGGASSSPPTSSSIASSPVSSNPSTHLDYPPESSSSTSSAVETTPPSGASIATLMSVVSAQSSVQASSSTVESSPTVIVPASSATTSSTTAQSSTLATSTSPTPAPSPSLLPSPSATAGTVPVATEAVTIVTTVTGQVKTIISTPPAATADPTLGQGAVSSNGISKGTVIGIVVGVALGIGLLIGLVVWFCLKRKHGKSSIDLTPPFSSTYSGEGASNTSRSGIPSRQVSQMSSAGLLAGKGPRIQTTGHGISNGLRGAETAAGFANDRRSVGTDQRLNPYALFAHDEARQSNLSLQDNQDYSRQLRVANPDP